MSKWLTILKSLGPKGKLNFFPGSNFEKFLDAISEEFRRLEDFTKNVQSEAIPTAINNMLEEWRNIYRINPDLTDQEVKALALSYYTATGNQSENYIETQIRIAFPDFDVKIIYTGSGICGLMECGTPAAVVGGVGSVAYVYATVTETQEKELQKLIDYYFPAHITVINQLTRPQANNPGAGIPFSLGLDGLGKTTGTDAPE